MGHLRGFRGSVADTIANEVGRDARRKLGEKLPWPGRRGQHGW